MNKKIIFISYFSTQEGSVTSEWVKDKLICLKELNYNVKLITSTENPKISIDGVKILRVPSLAPSIFFREWKTNFYSNFFIHLIFLPFSLTIGVFLELIERALFKRLGFGFWTWVPSSFLALIITSVFEKSIVLSSGGPASSHLTASLMKLFFNKSVIIELQDPLVGINIGHSHKGAIFFNLLEKFLISNSDKIAFVTRKAFNEAQSRHPKSKNIRHIYSSSYLYSVLNNQKKYIHHSNKVKLLHIGSIYGNRNFDLLIKAIELINESKKNYPLEFEITNVGNVSIENTIQSKHVPLVQFGNKQRLKALKMSREFDILLLIQHKDERSKLTIPYKTWDYLNLGLPIFGIINSLELENLLTSHGHVVSNVNDYNNIAEKLNYLINNYSIISKQLKTNTIVFRDQCSNLLKL